MKTKFLTFIYFFVILANIQAQDAIILHSNGGRTKVINKKINNVYSVEADKEFHIRIENANSYVYNYSFSKDTSEIIYEKPNIDEIIKQVLQMNQDNESDFSIGRLAEDGDEEKSKEILNKFAIFQKKHADALDSIIRISGDLEEVNSNQSKLMDCKKYVRNNIFEYKIEGIEQPKEPKTDSEKFRFLVLEVFKKKVDDFNKKRLDFLKTPDYYDYKVKVKENQKIVLKLSITPKLSGMLKDTGENLVIIELIPKYKWKRFEVVPNTALHYAGNTADYVIKEGILLEEKNIENYFRPGIILNCPAIKLGSNDEYSIGFGGGLYYSKYGANLGNITGNIVFSYTEEVRMSLGFGATQVSSGLKSGFVVNQLISESVSNINDIKKFDYKPTLTFGINITGFNLSLLK